MAQLTPEQREKIVAHLRDNSGVILAVQEARQHFPTLNESMEVVVILREELKHL